MSSFTLFLGDLVGERLRRYALAVLLIIGGSVMTLAPSAVALDASSSRVALVLGKDISPRLRTRLTQLLQQAQPNLAVYEDEKGSEDEALLLQNDFVIAIGETRWGRELIFDQELSSLGSEGFIVRSGMHSRVALLASRGNALDRQALRYGNIGAHFGAYALLGELGFAFLKPLAPILPQSLNWPEDSVDIHEKPYWPIRATHLHTQHPLEFTDLLQGWGKNGVTDEAGFHAMLPEWESYLEWLLANRQNRVEWILLSAKSWQAFADSQERIMRLGEIVDLAHAYGIAAGIDAPLVLKQQHAYRLIQTPGSLPEELAQLRHVVDWLMQAKFDFIGTETGTSEFSHPAVEQTLAWMNALASYSTERFGKPVYIKVHCSTGQTAAGYPDPQTGRPINFNMLPHYADKRMGVLPHTVQHYGLDDPAPTYGNENFAYMRDFLRQEVGTREVLYYPETAYWVSYDIDVPLFLPLYAERRLHDLRLLADDELQGRMGVGKHAGERMDGQLNFSSGFEWGYWFNEVVTARAAWNPQMEEPTDRAALLAMSSSLLQVFGPAKQQLAIWLADVAQAEHELLIHGNIDGTPPASIALRNGQAYMEGFDAWHDLSEVAAHWSLPGMARTEPSRLEFVTVRTEPIFGDHSVSYRSDVAPLLAQMEESFGSLARQGERLTSQIPEAAMPLFVELIDAANMTALRARQQHRLYEYAAKNSGLTKDERLQSLSMARKALDDAAVLVKKREAKYALADKERITGWRPGPTAYHFGYLWTVHSLYYWWRDEGKAVDDSRSPCYLNIINPIDMGFGEGPLLDRIKWLAKITSVRETRGCLDIPSRELTFPYHGERSRQ